MTYDDRDDRSPLLTPLTPSYGSAGHPHTPTRPSSRKVIVNATLKMATIFLLSTILLGGTLWLTLPTLEEADRKHLCIPTTFVQLHELNALLKKYRDIYPYRVIVCYVTTYLFIQAFSLPGSMYLSILGGAVWGVARALPLACCCVATGASLCYLLSAALGPALLTLPKWKVLLDKWGRKIEANKENVIPFLIVLRIVPLPPHWVVNVVCPHVGIGLIPFWLSTGLGVLGVTVIHTTIGSGLDDMTSADDFHLISWRNFFGLAAVVVGVMIPVGLRYWFRKEVQGADGAALVLEEEEEEGVLGEAGSEDRVLVFGPPKVVKKSGIGSAAGPPLVDEEDSDDEEDIILEAGPVISDKMSEVDSDSIKTLDLPSGDRKSVV